MSVSFGAVVIGTPDPLRHAAFYRGLLGWEVVDEQPTGCGCGTRSASGRG